MGQFVMMTHTSNITYCFVSTSLVGIWLDLLN